jgi:predicted small secreted protein
MKTVLLSIVSSALAAALLSSCNTFQGASRDVGAVINSISKPFHH